MYVDFPSLSLCSRENVDLVVLGMTCCQLFSSFLFVLSEGKYYFVYMKIYTNYVFNVAKKFDNKIKKHNENFWMRFQNLFYVLFEFCLILLWVFSIKLNLRFLKKIVTKLLKLIK